MARCLYFLCHKRAWSPTYSMRFVIAGAVVCLVAACVRELTPEEASFYQRVHLLKVGVTLETVKAQLGEPSRTPDADTECQSRGGRKEWVYESFETAGGKKPLRAGTFAFCADQNGIVVAIFEIAT